jgi:hypothetical protein
MITREIVERLIAHFTENNDDGLQQCQLCERRFPPHLVEPFYECEGEGGFSIEVCAICAVGLRRMMLGWPETSPFTSVGKDTAAQEARAFLAHSD